MNRSDQARSDLRRWADSRPQNFYEDDDYLRGALRVYLGAERLARIQPVLQRAGADAAGSGGGCDAGSLRGSSSGMASANAATKWSAILPTTTPAGSCGGQESCRC